MDGEAGRFVAGTGRLDDDRDLALLRESGYTGAVVLHGLTEAQVDASVAFLHEKLQS